MLGPPVSLGVGLAILAMAALLAAAVVWAPVGSGPGSGREREDRPGAESNAGRRSPTPSTIAPGRSPGPAVDAHPPPADREVHVPASRPPMTAPADPELEALGRAFRADPRVAGRRVSASVWVEGRGEILSLDADRPLMPASVQKLATAIAAMEHLPSDFAFTTQVTGSAPVGPGGVIAGDLVLVAGGDPTLRGSGPHSLEALARTVHAAGVRRVEGRVLIDATRWSADHASPGWIAWQQPRFAGWLSPLLVDGNRWPRNADTGAPAVANGRRFVAALAAHGIRVRESIVATTPTATTGGAGSADELLAEVRSAPRDELVRRMLQASDNLMAEALWRELGFRHAGQGSYETGAAAVRAALAGLVGRSVGGVDVDGSGLSRDDRRTAAEWRALLVAATHRPWWPAVHDALPLAASSGTLAGRFGGTAAAGNVRAKTGTTIPARALAGVFTTDSGETATFAVIVNGTEADPPVGAEQAIDRFVAGLVAAT
jgi:D-alanyl-D-alanine carboxypeptidase/D-alanyl-D-alanine-endopeptidase (penicillin-binding protein 4)